MAPDDLEPFPQQASAQEGADTPAPEVAPAQAPDQAPTQTDGHTSDGGPLLVVNEADDETASQAFSFPVVGIGGSAGSVEAFIEIFKHVSPRTGMAFVLVMHLATDQQSHMSAIISRHTTMSVLALESGMVPQQNHVYVLQPDAFVRLAGGAFQLTPRDNARPFLPVDVFFQSLAKTQKIYGVGIVLSGMDGDGALGLRAVKGEGGFSLVQSPETARHPGMPRSSIAVDHVDMVLEPEAIGRYLSRLGQRFQEPEFRRLQTGEVSASEEKNFDRTLKLLRTVSGVDFRLYKQTTIRRRIARRMLMQKMDSMPEYINLLGGNITELRALQEDILINVTRFFRDPEVFEALRSEIIPGIVENRNNEEQIRVWVAGCSSGEEVYSIAICLLEYLTGRTVEPSIQIFGTDASEANIQKARLGIYPESIANDVSPERLRRFFIKTEKGFQVAKRVRDLCIFARQNLCTDPPFSRLDLVSCRNVLIYFGNELQRRVISTFHYALRQDGYLLLGNTETIREHTDLFTVSDRARKIFVRTGTVANPGVLYANTPVRLGEPETLSAAQAMDVRNEFDLGRTADRVLLARYTPPSVVVDTQMQVVLTRGRTTPFLSVPQGTPSHQLSRMAPDSIAPLLTDAVKRAVEQDLPVHLSGLSFQDGPTLVQASLDVLPIPGSPNTGASKHFLVVFLAEADHQLAAVRNALPATVDRTVEQLYQDLASTKIYLNSLLDEREASNQELISANEEIQSANEELQSTNEELETTKEELQSSNEELQTVNEELENRNGVLAETSNDLSNLLNSVNLPVLMLSNSLEIRHFTPQTQRIMSVRPQDIGRPFGDIRFDLALDNLEARLLEVLDTLTAQEIEVQDHEGRWYFLRIRPYRTSDNKIDGLVLVLVDIDQTRRSQQQLRDARDFASSIIANIPLPLAVINSSDQVISTNDAFCRLAGLSRSTLEQRSITDLAAILWNMDTRLRAMLRELQADAGKSSSFEWQFKNADDVRRALLVRGCSLQPDGERFILLTMEDISDHKEVEGLLKSEGERLATQISLTTAELDRNREELRALTGNLMTSQEEERRRLARELHDDISQRMAVLDMNCETALRTMETDPAEARANLQNVKERIASVSEDVRKLSHRLHPSIIEHLGAAAALESLLDEFTRGEGMLTSFYAEEVPVPVPPEVATVLYRITQEALRNVAKHAGNAHVKVSLMWRSDLLVLEVTDSGAGFSLRRHGSGLGLISMKERARLIGARMQIKSAPRRGTRVRVSVPLPAQQGDEA